MGKERYEKGSLVSVVIPTFNRGHILPRAINSVLEQTYPNIEIIVVDDGSTDDTDLVVAEIKKKSRGTIKYYKQENKGANVARNLGVFKSEGKYISFLDSDDEYLPNRLEYSVKEISKSNFDFSLCNSIEVRNGRSKIGSDVCSSRILDRLTFVKTLPPHSASFMFCSKKVFKKFEFDESLKSYQDTDFILRYLKERKILFIPLPVVRRYKDLNENRLSSNPGIKLDGINNILDKISKNVYDLNIEESEQLLFIFLSQKGMFYVLSKEYKKARECFKEGQRKKNVPFRKKLRNHIIYYLSFFPLILSFTILISKVFWKLGILNVK